MIQKPSVEDTSNSVNEEALSSFEDILTEGDREENSDFEDIDETDFIKELTSSKSLLEGAGNLLRD